MSDNKKELSITQAQSIADSFSVGKVINVKKFEDKKITVTTRLSPKNLKANIFLAASYANKVPNWLSQNRTEDDWNFKELSEELNTVGIMKHADTFQLTLYSLKTTHGQYLLIGFSPSGNLPSSAIKRILKSKLGIEFVQAIPTSHSKETYCSHQYDIHWYLFSSIKLSKAKAEKILYPLVGKSISILIGYGAPILADIGDENLNGFPEAKLFTDEYWWVEENGKKVTNRWEVPNEFFKSEKGLVIDDLYFDNRHKRTFLKLNTGQTIVINSDEQLTSWYFDFPNGKFSLKFTGKGEFIQFDYYQTMYKTKKRKSRAQIKRTENEQTFLEYAQISQEVAYNLLSSFLNLEITEISEDTGKSFGLELGNQFDAWRHQGLITIDGEWVLTKAGKKIASSETHAFNYLSDLVKTVWKEKLISFPSTSRWVLSLSSDITVELSLKRHWLHKGLVTFFNRQEGYHIGFDGKVWEYTGSQDSLRSLISSHEL